MFICEQSINLRRKIGFVRMTLFSLLLTFLSFCVLYEGFLLLSDEPLTDRNALIFFISLIAIYPLHKLLHTLPLLRHYKYLNISFNNKKSLFNFMNVRVKRPVLIFEYILALIAPFLILTVAVILLIIPFPMFAHYFIIIASINLGISLIDFIYIAHIIKCPYATHIDERKHGLEILMKQKFN